AVTNEVRGAGRNTRRCRTTLLRSRGAGWNRATLCLAAQQVSWQATDARSRIPILQRVWRWHPPCFCGLARAVTMGRPALELLDEPRAPKARSERIGILRARQEVDAYISTYTSLLRSSGEIQVRAFEDAHVASSPSLHPFAADDHVIDVHAFGYGAARLPAIM